MMVVVGRHEWLGVPLGQQLLLLLPRQSHLARLGVLLAPPPKQPDDPGQEEGLQEEVVAGHLGELPEENLDLRQHLLASQTDEANVPAKAGPDWNSQGTSLTMTSSTGWSIWSMTNFFWNSWNFKNTQMLIAEGTL